MPGRQSRMALYYPRFMATVVCNAYRRPTRQCVPERLLHPRKLSHFFFRLLNRPAVLLTSLRSAHTTKMTYAPAVFTVSPASKLMGSLFNFLLLGSLSIQTYIYRRCFPKDPLAVRFLVHSVLVACLACILLEAMQLVGVNFGAAAGFSQSPTIWAFTPVFGGLIAMGVQFFYVYRIIIIRRAAWPVGVVIGLISIAQCGSGMGWGILGAMGEPAQSRHRRILINIWLIGGATADVLVIPVVTSALLLGASKQQKQTRDIVNNVVRLIIETNALSAAVALVGLFQFVCHPTGMEFIGPTMILPGIYANTLLVMLNQRAAMRLAARHNSMSVIDSYADADLDDDRAQGGREDVERPGGPVRGAVSAVCDIGILCITVIMLLHWATSRVLVEYH
ncbi:hypothetical protein C8R46DRAFT_1352170 [Mycena filopes]|nr:hypothetical protein C8R46DRAFT_1352170 [Mycena filopes]